MFVEGSELEAIGKRTLETFYGESRGIPTLGGIIPAWTGQAPLAWLGMPLHRPHFGEEHSMGTILQDPKAQRGCASSLRAPSIVSSRGTAGIQGFQFLSCSSSKHSRF